MQSLLNSFCVKSFTQLHVLISVGFGLWPDSYILQIKESENRVCQKQPSIDASTWINFSSYMRKPVLSIECSVTNNIYSFFKQ